ncbi:hypothetical protein LAZ67_22002170 [Cordylochernes scorpioides]|uniref:Transposase n=1 Tax=Cordylochernes scorpioides TaxID=51811 RepID=A0ABY6LTN9_9ARAC|nr:hypothetical protein LAZ67_22002170 [Cordylochernes scorpioides]
MPGHRKRRQFKQTDAFTRGMVIRLKRAGWSIRQIAADTHLGASTVHRLWRRWLEQGNVAIYRNAGATRVTSALVDRRILRQAVAAPQATCTAILQHVQDTLDHSISTRTISCRLVANGLHSCSPLRRLPLTPPNRRQRLEWCRARSTWMTEWHRVVFSDESRFCLSSDSRRVRVWRRRGERSNPAAIVERPTVRQRGIMVWGAIAYDCGSPLFRIQGTMTAQRYVDDVLRPVTLPYLQGVPNALYQQDNARPHTARISQQALQDVQMPPWPPYSPDLSPIEHVWDIIGRRLHALPQPCSEDELWQMVEREWRAIPQDAIRTLIDSLPRRVAACIAVRELVAACGFCLAMVACRLDSCVVRSKRSQDITDSPATKSRQDSGRQGTSKQIDHCLYRKMEQGREENPKEPMESDPDSESGGSPTFPKKENTLGRTQEVPPGQEDVTPPPPVSDVLGSLARTIYQLSSATGLSRDVELPRYDGSYEAQSFFDNYDAQADLAQLHYTDRLRRLPNLLQGKALHYFRSLKLDKLYYVDARQALIDLFPETTNASFAQFLAIKLTDRSSLEEYYQKKTVCGLQLNLPHKILLESLTDGLPVADQRIVAAVQPNTLQAWYSVVSRVRGTHSASASVPTDDQNNAQPFLRTITEVQCSATMVSATQLLCQSTPFILQVLWRHALARPVPQTACTEPSKTCVPSHNLSAARQNCVVLSRTLPS